NMDELTGRHISDLFENLSPDETDKYLYRSIHQTDPGDDGHPVSVYCINHAQAELTLHYLPHNQTVVAVLSTAAGLAWPEKQVMQERLQLAIDAAGMGIWEWSVADNQLRWDSVMYSLYGLNAITFELDYARWSALILRDDLPKFDGAVHAMLLGGEPLHETVRVRRADGEIRYISMHGKLITDKYDLSEHIIGVNFDITPLKEAEVSLRESEERFALAAQAAQEGIWDWNMQTGEVWFSPQWKANFGYPDHELVNDFTTWDSLIDPEDRKRFLRLTQAYNQGVLTRFETTLRFKHKKGHWVSVRSRAVHLKNEQGDVVRMVGSNEDITEILQHEAELDDSRKRMDLTIQCAGLGIWDWNLISNEVLFGGKWAEMLGYDDSDIAPNITSWVDLTHPDDLIAAEKILHSHFSGHLPVYSAEFRMRSKDGSWRWILGVGRVNAYTREGKPMRILGVNIDIHTRKTNETALQQAILQAEAASRAKNEFLANMSHEIRTPLNAVLGFASLLEKSDLDIRQRDFVDSVQIAGNALLFLINDLLDFSKIESGRLELNNTEFNVRHLFEEALTIIAPAACDKHLEMACIVSPEVPEHAFGDSARIRQILLHLLNNAIKFTSAGHVVTRVGCLFSDSQSVCVRVDITDTGVGITASHRMKLFNAFTQADNSTTRRFGGTGMGLSVCKSLIDAMNGRIGTEEAEGGGSVFWIEIPLTVCAAPLPPIYARTDKKILLLDAFAPRAQSLMILLERAGFKADYFADSIQGSAAADQTDYLLLIADERAGAALLRQQPHMADLPCIILTDGFADWAVGVAPDYCLAKPVVERSLRRCLEEALALAVPAAQILQPFNHLSVLLAEDNLVNQRVAVLMLEHLGCRVDVAANGLEALNAVQKGHYDLVLMDCQMPEMDGYTSVSMIRALNGAQSDVPVVALTANAFKADEERCYAAGMNDFIAKPISNDQLMRVLARFFPTKSQAEPVQSGGIMNSFVDPESIDKEMSSIYQTFEDLKKMLGMDMTDELIQLFLPTLDECLSNLGPLIEAGEGEPVVVCAHKLKGAAAQMGALALADLCKKVELAGRDNQLAHARPLHAEILALGGAVGQRLRSGAA
ncbi:MAG: PAS domain-containing protein, partial [Iodobacter sp.]